MSSTHALELSDRPRVDSSVNDIPSLPGTGPYGELTYNRTTTHRQRLRPVLIYFLNPHHNSSQLSPRSMAARLSLCGSDCWVHVIRTISMSDPSPCTASQVFAVRAPDLSALACPRFQVLRNRRTCFYKIAALNTSVSLHMMSLSLPISYVGCRQFCHCLALLPLLILAATMKHLMSR